MHKILANRVNLLYLKYFMLLKIVTFAVMKKKGHLISRNVSLHM